jgi:hypothetical protein
VSIFLTLQPADFGKLIADETEKWGKMIRAANIVPRISAVPCLLWVRSGNP